MAELATLTGFLDRLDAADMHYTLASEREGAIMVGVTVPGERWEIEFMDTGEVEIEVFKSTGELRDFSVIEELFERDLEG